MKSFILRSVLISFAIISLNSCKKEEPVPGGNATSCEVISSDIVTTTTLTNRVSDPNIADYCITEFISVKEGAGLIIEPGVVIEFSNGAGIEVGTYGTSTRNAGYIIADGIPADKITFTGAAKTPGAWRGIAISPTNTDPRNLLDNCIVEYTGSSVLKVFSAGFGYKTAIGVGHSSANETGLLSIKNCIIRNNIGKGYSCKGGNGLNEFVNNKFVNNSEEGVFISANGFRKLDVFSTFTNNRFNGFYQSNFYSSIENLSDTVIHTWAGTNSKFFLSRGVRLNTTGTQLTLDRGIEVTMGNGTMIHSRNGLFQSLGYGTGVLRVIIKGDSGSISTWKGVLIESGQNNLIVSTDISNGGSDTFLTYGCNGKANLGVYYWAGNAGKVTVRDCAFRHSGGCGIYNETASITQHGDLTQSGNSYYGNAGSNVCN